MLVVAGSATVVVTGVTTTVESGESFRAAVDPRRLEAPCREVRCRCRSRRRTSIFPQCSHLNENFAQSDLKVDKFALSLGT